MNDAEYKDAMNRAIAAIKKTGAKVYFAFAPVDSDALIAEADPAAYDALLLATYTELTGILGSSEDYIYEHKYFFDLAYHPNDYGRVKHTYRLYLDLAELLGKTPKSIDSVGTDFQGCLFE